MCSSRACLESTSLRPPQHAVVSGIRFSLTLSVHSLKTDLFVYMSYFIYANVWVWNKQWLKKYMYIHIINTSQWCFSIQPRTCGGASTGGGLRPRPSSERRGDRLCRVMRWMDPVETRSGGETGVGVTGVLGVVGVFIGAETWKFRAIWKIIVWCILTGCWKESTASRWACIELYMLIATSLMEEPIGEVWSSDIISCSRRFNHQIKIEFI